MMERVAYATVAIRASAAAMVMIFGQSIVALSVL